MIYYLMINFNNFIILLQHLYTINLIYYYYLINDYYLIYDIDYNYFI